DPLLQEKLGRCTDCERRQLDGCQASVTVTCRSGVINVRFGSLADILRCLSDARFTPRKRTYIGNERTPAKGQQRTPSLASELSAKSRTSVLPDAPKLLQFSFLPLSVTTSRNAAISRLRNSTSAGIPPPAEACPVTVPGEIVIIRTSLMARAADCGSNSGLSKSLVPVRTKVFAFIDSITFSVSPLKPGDVPTSCFS